jgi:hypothetical protein
LTTGHCSANQGDGLLVALDGVTRRPLRSAERADQRQTWLQW